MRCKDCDYRLWNLTARECPECGRPFKPSEFDFVLNSVRFCCPHCDQPYYGTGDKGHLVPDEFDCVSCHQHIHMDEMVLFPTDKVREEQTEVDHHPWLERKKRGVFRGWFATIGRGMVGPGKLMRVTPENSSVLEAWWFSFLVILAVYVASLGIFFAFIPLGAVSGIVGIVAVPIAVLMMMGVWGLTIQLMLVLLCRQRGGLGRTFQAVCYSSGTCVVAAVPCMAHVLSPVVGIWWTISTILTIKEAHRISGGRAAAAVLPLPILVVLSLAGIAAWGAFFAFNTMPAALARANAAAAAMASAEAPAQAVLTYALQNQDKGPRHAAQLIADGSLAASDVIAPTSTTVETDVPVGDVSLARLVTLTPESQIAFADAAADLLPPNTIAHRLGDMVFTYHGIDLAKADRELWTVVTSPDPDAGNPVVVQGVTSVGLADGSTFVLPVQAMASYLELQNDLRAEFGLPPLPDPSTVTHDQPAVFVEPP